MSQLRICTTTLPEQQQHGATVFPQAYQAQACQSEDGASIEDAAAWVETHRERLLEEASVHGALLLRGLPARTPADFDRVVTAFGLPNFPYAKSLSNAVRVNRTERVFTANEAPSDVTIFLHHEMAQTPVYPQHIFFFCEQPAPSGGATPICRSDVLLERLEAQAPRFVADCEAKGLRYTNVMPAGDDPNSGMGRSWQSTLGVETREAAERRLSDLGYRGEWLADGCLRATTPVLAAVREVAPGRRTFFNQLIAAFQGWKDARNDPSKSICHGDGSPLDQDAVLLAAELAEQLTFDVPWQQGDVALLDNFVAMHGRRSFSGPRRVLASLASAHHSAPLDVAG